MMKREERNKFKKLDVSGKQLGREGCWKEWDELVQEMETARYGEIEDREGDGGGLNLKKELNSSF